MSYSNDNTTVTIHIRNNHPQLKTYRAWLNERNIKYSLVHAPRWDAVPSGINMRNEDALIFKLTFGL